MLKLMLTPIFIDLCRQMLFAASTGPMFVDYIPGFGAGVDFSHAT
jgi:hypothetical protein